MTERMVHVAEALDGSWFAFANSESEVQQKIAEREPDVVKRSGYRILVEPYSVLLARAMRECTPFVQGQLVKWDGDPPAGGIPADAATNPSKYRQVSEVIDCGDRSDPGPTVIYRRDSASVS